MLVLSGLEEAPTHWCQDTRSIHPCCSPASQGKHPARSWPSWLQREVKHTWCGQDRLGLLSCFKILIKTLRQPWWCDVNAFCPFSCFAIFSTTCLSHLILHPSRQLLSLFPLQRKYPACGFLNPFSKKKNHNANANNSFYFPPQLFFVTAYFFVKPLPYPQIVWASFLLVTVVIRGFFMLWQAALQSLLGFALLWLPI